MDIYVGNLPYKTTSNDLEKVFSEYGAVAETKVIADRDTGRSKGFGFVKMQDAAEAQNAIQSLDGAELDGRNIKVNEARPQTKKPQHA